MSSVIAWVIVILLAMLIVYLVEKLMSLPEKRLKRRVKEMRIDDIPRFPLPEESNMLTVSEAAVRYGINSRTLRRWLKERKVAGWKDGRMWMIDRRSLEKYLEERK